MEIEPGAKEALIKLITTQLQDGVQYAKDQAPLVIQDMVAMEVLQFKVAVIAFAVFLTLAVSLAGLATKKNNEWPDIVIAALGVVVLFSAAGALCAIIASIVEGCEAYKATYHTHAYAFDVLRSLL